MYTTFTLSHARFHTDTHSVTARDAFSHILSPALIFAISLSLIICVIFFVLFPNLHKVQTYENRKNVTQ